MALIKLTNHTHNKEFYLNTDHIISIDPLDATYFKITLSDSSFFKATGKDLEYYINSSLLAAGTGPVPLNETVAKSKKAVEPVGE